SLAEELKKGPIPWRRTIEILSGCLRGLAHIHAKSVIHRDIKPENIFITAEGSAKIGDFGVARRVSETDHAETRVGTPLYIAPEVIKDPFGHGYDFQVDIYSMGMVAYEMLTGKLPFEV
ncbi:serine/threonine protein kinase, partial [Oceanidesulfovibrio indonesiensis]|uniref:serine/threonine protein kinase n=1 Tax=Oceanidesulfovibrio indonesiensis TaxID=54767 RepID=UPI001184FB31